MSARERELARGIAERLRGAGHRALLAGGCVRDLLLGREPEDWDIATSARPEEVAALFPRTVGVGAAFGVMLVLLDGDTPFEVATFRKDLGYTDLRRPDAVAFTDEREDALRRDFTINGLFLDPVTDEVLDYVGGRADLERRVIRAIGDAEARIAEDRLRMLRAVRFAARFGFAVDRDLHGALRKHASSVVAVSAERIRDEIVKMLTTGDSAVALELLDATGLAAVVLPEVVALRGDAELDAGQAARDAWDHTLLILASLVRPTSATLAFAALLHDIGKPALDAARAGGSDHVDEAVLAANMAATIAARLKLSNAEREQVTALVRDQLRFREVPGMRQSELTRFLRRPGFEEHLELHRLDCVASGGSLETWALCKQALTELGPEGLNPTPLVNGDDLKALGLRPGKQFRDILTEVEDLQLEGRLAGREEALAHVRKHFVTPA